MALRTRPVPFYLDKGKPWDFWPDGTVKTYDAGKWALYYSPIRNFSFIVIDFGTHYKINHYSGLLQVPFAISIMASKPCCNED